MQKIISTLREKLQPIYGEREARAITYLLLEEVCGLTRNEIWMCKDIEISADDKQKLSLFSERLVLGEPVQQVLGYEWFAGRKYAVNRSVLIPRPETAELVDWIVRDLTAAAEVLPTLQILDIGTGSGCIAISLAAAFPSAQVVGFDISIEALATAESNARNLETPNVSFVQQDILHPEISIQKYDLVVSNPPYIMNKESVEMDANVLNYEPHTALFVPDEDPLLFYRAIGQYGLQHLTDGGRLFFEINAQLGSETCTLLREMGYDEVLLRQDADGRDRMIRCVKPSSKNND